MREEFEHRPQGTCSVLMKYVVEDGILVDFYVERGCNGNLKGIKNLILNMRVEHIISKLEGIKCGNRSTSCPDQIAIGLKNYLKSKGE